jgi:hypothetical protein
MHEHTTISFPHQQLLTEDPLTEVVRQGAQRLLAQAIEGLRADSRRSPHYGRWEVYSTRKRRDSLCSRRQRPVDVPWGPCYTGPAL